MIFNYGNFRFRSLLNKLPDKGENVKKFYEKIAKELKARSQIDEAAKLFSKLNVAAVGKKVVNKMEWNGALAKEDDTNVPVLDSDDEEDVNPFKILANTKENKKKIIKEEKLEESLITNEDLNEINSFKEEKSILANYTVNQNIDTTKFEHLRQRILAKENEVDINNISFEPHIEYVCNKETTAPQKDKFKPYHTTINNSLDPEKEKQRIKHKNWENTAATPPPLQNHSAKVIPLHEAISMEMTQKSQHIALKEKILVEKLEKRKQIIDKNNVQVDTKSYRNPSEFDDFDEDDDGGESDDSSLVIDSEDECVDFEPEKSVIHVNFTSQL